VRSTALEFTLDTSTNRTKPTSSLTRGYLICLASTVFLAFTAIFIRYLTVQFGVPPLVLAFWRDFFVVVALGLVFLLFRPNLFRIGRNQIGFFAIYGLVLALFNSLWTVSVALNGAAVSTVLAYSSVAYTAILGRWIFAERLDRVKIFVILLSLAGCVLVAGAYNLAALQLNLMGIIAGLLTGLGYAAYPDGQASAKRQISPWTAMLYSFGFATVILLGFNFLPGSETSGLGSTNLLWLCSSMVGWTVLISLAVVPTMGGFVITVSLTYLPASAPT
jgi:drug/metabolite transporter (DMT)-like permease